MLAVTTLAFASLFSGVFDVSYNSGSIKGTLSTNGTSASIYVNGTTKNYTEESFNWPFQQVADVNGDGNTDFIAINGNYCKVIVGITGGGFQVLTGTNTIAYAFMNEVYFNWPWKRIADVDGDNKADFITISGNQMYVIPGIAFVNSGYNQGKFNYAGRYYEVQPYFAWGYKEIVRVRGASAFDFVAIDGTNSYVVPGVGFTESGVRKAKFDYNSRIYDNQIYYAWEIRELKDVTRDGKVDLITYRSPDKKDLFVVPGTTSGFSYQGRMYASSDLFRSANPPTISGNQIKGLEWTGILDYSNNCFNFEQYSTSYIVVGNSIQLEYRNPTGGFKGGCPDPVASGLWWR